MTLGIPNGPWISLRRRTRPKCHDGMRYLGTAPASASDDITNILLPLAISPLISPYHQSVSNPTTLPPTHRKPTQTPSSVGSRQELVSNPNPRLPATRRRKPPPPAPKTVLLLKIFSNKVYDSRKLLSVAKHLGKVTRIQSLGRIGGLINFQNSKGAAKFVKSSRHAKFTDIGKTVSPPTYEVFNGNESLGVFKTLTDAHDTAYNLARQWLRSKHFEDISGGFTAKVGKREERLFEFKESVNEATERFYDLKSNIREEEDDMELRVNKDGAKEVYLDMSWHREGEQLGILVVQKHNIMV
ncbi:hypothetical protein BDD12DRAFT_879893 [Trichophaea hybrida]|nr:hypothetical protein BDD12DRAFT_879893 [Trichophaea hybrida]